ncbi:MAG TPA: hypothetical protein VFF65_04745 [Phycisphaerales bacterium]|nr:hypothetical protein [Phycisphaerales bacterium]
MRIHKNIRNLVNALAVGVALLGATFGVLADKLHLKDGRVLDGTVVRQDGAFVVFNVNGKEEIFDAAEVLKIEKTEAAKNEAKTEAPKPEVNPAAPKDEGKPAEPAKDAGAAAGVAVAKSAGKTLSGKPARIAIIPFGPPQSWKNNKELANVDTLVGGEISVKPWMDIIPLLKKDGVDTVVVQINSGGGYLMEMNRFPDVFREYKKNFRVVAWVESAISAAAMSPWIINEFYMKPGGHIGGCTGYSGPGVAIKGVELLEILDQMKQLSIEAGRDPLIMRAMQIEQPLSCNIDENGNVTFFGDSTSGSFRINPDGQVLTLNSEVARKIKFSSGTASDRDELAKAMGLSEYQFAGADAVKHMEDYLLKAHKAQAFFIDTALKYILARDAAVQLARNPNDPRFSTELGKARQALNEMKRQVELNPNFPFILGNQIGVENMGPAWFAQQEEQLRELVRRAREAEDQRRRQR